MTKPRVIETDDGIQGEFNVVVYDRMQRHLRDRGWIETPALLKGGIRSGSALEIGPGPGYLGLEWLKTTSQTRLEGLDISPDMIVLARRNADEYGVSDRVKYTLGSSDNLPFEPGSFDAVFSNGSLHEWADPHRTFQEIGRVLKPEGLVFISDLRRDMPMIVRWFLWINTKPKDIRPGLVSSIRASYTPEEIRRLIQGTMLQGCHVSSNAIGLTISGKPSR